MYSAVKLWHLDGLMKQYFHNSVLSVELDNLKKQLKGFKYSYVNYFNLTFDVINNPSKYGR